MLLLNFSFSFAFSVSCGIYWRSKWIESLTFEDTFVLPFLSGWCIFWVRLQSLPVPSVSFSILWPRKLTTKLTEYRSLSHRTRAQHPRKHSHLCCGDTLQFNYTDVRLPKCHFQTTSQVSSVFYNPKLLIVVDFAENVMESWHRLLYKGTWAPNKNQSLMLPSVVKSLTLPANVFLSLLSIMTYFSCWHLFSWLFTF